MRWLVPFALLAAGCNAQQLESACEDYSKGTIEVAFDFNDIDLTLPAGVEDQTLEHGWTCLNLNVYAEDTGTNYWFTWTDLPAELPAGVRVGNELPGWLEHAENREIESGRTYVAQVFVDWIPEGSGYASCELAASEPFEAP